MNSPDIAVALYDQHAQEQHAVQTEAPAAAHA